MSKEKLNQQPKNPSNLTRFERGWATLAEVDGPNGPDHALIESLAEAGSVDLPSSTVCLLV